jgi:hypothetical protein
MFRSLAISGFSRLSVCDPIPDIGDCYRLASMLGAIPALTAAPFLRDKVTYGTRYYENDSSDEH